MARDHKKVTGENLDAAGIVADAEAGKPAALATMARYEERLARGLAHVVNIVDPQIVVLGGGLSNIKRLYANLPGLMRPFVFSDHVATRILPPRHGDSSGVRGAAWLWAPGERP
jgi:predicted NBD/HSP70 family sugar kinase